MQVVARNILLSLLFPSIIAGDDASHPNPAAVILSRSRI